MQSQLYSLDRSCLAYTDYQHKLRTDKLGHFGVHHGCTANQHICQFSSAAARTAKSVIDAAFALHTAAMVHMVHKLVPAAGCSTDKCGL